MRAPHNWLLPGHRVGAERHWPDPSIASWWMACESGEWVLTRLLPDGRVQECFDSGTSKGADHIYLPRDYLGPWRPVLDLVQPPVPAWGRLDPVRA